MSNYRHGMFGTSTYKSWEFMKSRCNNPNDKDYHNYGGRGINCDAYEDFIDFFNDMGVKPPEMFLDRIDVNGNYEPGNCRWVSIKISNQNKRTVTMISVGVSGCQISLKEFAKEVGLTTHTIKSYLDHGIGSYKTRNYMRGLNATYN